MARVRSGRLPVDHGDRYLVVLTGVFLHETFRVAKSDHELMIRGKMRENKALKDQMAILFNDMDTHSTGKVHREDFQATFNHPRVSLYLAALGLSYKDANELWGVVMEEVGQTPSGGEVSTDDLTWAIGKIRGEGRSVNVVMALQQIRRLVAGLQESGLISAPLAGPHDPISRDLLDDSFVQGGCGPSETRVAEI
ncbi:unnamed protein product [Prorocentrum cordatum]|uniref:EF-hand domain-containing protein n=1 Tax=Prorocentrum cordatum TaxID=2364126 RepID=A0ABN9T4I0_9DINO|nr:unnamed protein product [Polarella glacialis]